MAADSPTVWRDYDTEKASEAFGELHSTFQSYHAQPGPETPSQFPNLSQISSNGRATQFLGPLMESVSDVEVPLAPIQLEVAQNTSLNFGQQESTAVW